MGRASRSRRMRIERGIYLQPNGKYAVCLRRAGRLCYHAVGFDLELARRERQRLIAATQDQLPPRSPRVRFDTVAYRWLKRFEAKVAGGERHERTLEAHRYYLNRHLLPALAARRISALSADDIAALLDKLRDNGCSPKTCAGALATLHGIIRYARRHGWIAVDPVDQLGADERPRPTRRRQRVLGRDEIQRLLAACTPRDRLMVATALYTGVRISELLGSIWEDIDLDQGEVHVRAQLSRAHRGSPPRRVATKTPASVRDVPLLPQLARLLADHRRHSRLAKGSD